VEPGEHFLCQYQQEDSWEYSGDLTLEDFRWSMMVENGRKAFQIDDVVMEKPLSAFLGNGSR
jgi:hypothetical protein